MNIFLKIIKGILKYLSITLVFIIVFFPFITRLETMTKSNEEIYKELSKTDYSESFFESSVGKLHIIETGQKDAPAILYIHGSPGSFDAFTPYINDKDLQAKYNNIFIDRAGYGKTEIPHSKYLKDQALPLIEYINSQNKDFNIVAHSYGGPVALEVGLNTNDKVKNILLVAPTASGEAEQKTYWKRFFQELILRHPLKGFTSKNILNSSFEMKQLINDANDQKGKLKDLKQNIVILHGDADFIANVSNIEYLTKNLPNAKVEIIRDKKYNHFIIWTEFEKIKNLILNFK